MFTVLTAILIIPIMLMVALAVETTAYRQKREKLQSILDAAVLAAAGSTEQDKTKRLQDAMDMFQAQAASKSLTDAKAEFRIEGEQIVGDAITAGPILLNMFATYPDITLTSVAGGGGGEEGALDMVICIDATTSMGGPINSVRRSAATFPEDFREALKKRGIDTYDLLRIKVIYFRDIVFPGDIFASSGTVWAESPFFDLPQENDGYRAFLQANGTGGPYNTDFPESGHECLYKGMTSEWQDLDKAKARQSNGQKKVTSITPLIVMYTDAAPKPVSDPASRRSPQNPEGMPNTWDKFQDAWNDSGVIDQDNKTFILYGPCADNAWKPALSMTGAICGGSVTSGLAGNVMAESIAETLSRRFKSEAVYLSR